MRWHGEAVKGFSFVSKHHSTVLQALKHTLTPRVPLPPKSTSPISLPPGIL